MKLKSLPEDFLVREITEFRYGRGSFAYYRLSKKSIGTPEAIEAILRSWNLSRSQVSYGGLKDRHAETSQFLTIYQGPKQSYEERSFYLEYLGQADHAYTAKDILANEFEVTLRGIQPERHGELEEKLERLGTTGIVNYFDDQRFGSVGFSGEFIGASWCKGDYERTLFLAIAEPNDHDRPREREQKELLRHHWGQWDLCKDILDRSHRRSIVTYLCDHPQDFRRAVGLIRIDLRSIYVAAFQSCLWNRWLSAILMKLLPSDDLETLSSRIGPLVIPKRIDDEARETLQQLELPLPSARQKEYPILWQPLLEEVLSPFGLELHQIRLRYPRDTFFSKGSRLGWIGVPGLTYRFGDDALHPEKEAVRLSFSLPKGSYATMIVKQLTQVVEATPIHDNDETEV